MQRPIAHLPDGSSGDLRALYPNGARERREPCAIPAVVGPEQASPCPREFGNAVLDALDRETAEGLAPALAHVELRRDETLYGVGDATRFVYFPRTSVVSLLCISRSGKTVEVSPVGANGVVGLSGLLGAGGAAHWGRVLVAGAAWRAPKGDLLAALEALPATRVSVNRAVYAELAEISIVAACTRVHTIDQQVARWLLTVGDRAVSNELPLTHECIADRLGTRRSSVSLALESYRREGRLDLRRGLVRLIDHGALEAASCECYRAIRSESERLAG